MSIKTDAPGPGNYEPRPEIIKDRIKSAKISQGGKRGLQGNKSCIDLPGPGMYDSGKKFGDDARKVTIQGKPNDNFRDLSPGPGAYGGDAKRVGGTKFGTGQRSQLGRTDVPGPGAYDSLHNTRGGVTISGHKGKSKIDDNPGPGSYNPDGYNPKNRPKSKVKQK